MFLRRMITGALFLGALGYGNFCWATDETVPPTTSNDNLQVLPQTPISLTELKKDIRSLSQQDLVSIAGDILSSCESDLSPEQLKACIEVQANIIDHLRKFKITGVAFAVDPNFALLFDSQNPKFDLYFKNDAGEIKQRKYQAYINSFGLKVECAININMIFFINTDLNYFDANTVIPLSWGAEVMPLWYPVTDTIKWPIEATRRDCYRCDETNEPLTNINIPLPVSLAAVNLTYASLPTHGGGMLMVSLGFGLKSEIVSLVTGGSLIPVEQKTPEKYLIH